MHAFTVKLDFSAILCRLNIHKSGVIDECCHNVNIVGFRSILRLFKKVFSSVLKGLFLHSSNSKVGPNKSATCRPLYHRVDERPQRQRDSASQMRHQLDSRVHQKCIYWDRRPHRDCRERPMTAVHEKDFKRIPRAHCIYMHFARFTKAPKRCSAPAHSLAHK